MQEQNDFDPPPAEPPAVAPGTALVVMPSRALTLACEREAGVRKSDRFWARLDKTPYALSAGATAMFAAGLALAGPMPLIGVPMAIAALPCMCSLACKSANATDRLRKAKYLEQEKIAAPKDAHWRKLHQAATAALDCAVLAGRATVGAELTVTAEGHAPKILHVVQAGSVERLDPSGARIVEHKVTAHLHETVEPEPGADGEDGNPARGKRVGDTLPRYDGSRLSSEDFNTIVWTKTAPPDQPLLQGGPLRLPLGARLGSGRSQLRLPRPAPPA